MVFDLLENGSAVWVMSAFPAVPRLAANLATIFTPIKWAFVSTSFLLLLAAVTALFFRRSRKHPLN